MINPLQTILPALLYLHRQKKEAEKKESEKKGPEGSNRKPGAASGRPNSKS